MNILLISTMKTPARPSEDEANIHSGAAKKDIALDVPFRRESVAAGGEEYAQGFLVLRHPINVGRKVLIRL